MPLRRTTPLHSESGAVTGYIQTVAQWLPAEPRWGDLRTRQDIESQARRREREALKAAERAKDEADAIAAIARFDAAKAARGDEE